MIYPLPELPGNSRLYIFHITPVPDSSVRTSIAELTENFLNEWTAHKAELHTAFEILHDRFLLIAINEDQVQASGCSLDSLHRFIKSLENQFSINLLDRMRVAYRNGDDIISSSLSELKIEIDNNRIDGDTIVFNTLFEKKGDLGTSFEMPLRLTWLNNYFNLKEIETTHHRVKP